jgi:hypothetical protein
VAIKASQHGAAPLRERLASDSGGPAFIKVAPDGDFAEASSKALSAYQLIESTVARDRYKDVADDTSVRNEYGRKDYEYFRPGETIPYKSREIKARCNIAYRRTGIIKNMIDLMGDFGSQGIKIVHPNPKVQRFYRAWARKIGLEERSERALNYLYRFGVFAASRHTAKISRTQERKMRASVAKITADTECDDELTIAKRTVPVRYTFLNPITLEVIGGELAQFVGKKHYAVRISRKLARMIQNPKPEYAPLIRALPQDMVRKIRNGALIIPLDPEKISVSHYKIDDWEEWADPIHFAILDDIYLYNKMKLADLSALDGAISQVRLWKLGDIEHGIFPTDTAIQKLADILLSNPGGGAFDLIWGPELSLQESETGVHQFLGKGKYEPVMNAIYEGMGVPPTLTGSGDAGMTNNFVALQTLIKRLEYGRMILTRFWQQEIELVRQAMGYQKGATIQFDNNMLTDEQSTKALLIQLADRDIISVNTLLERFKEDPEIERLRIKKENDYRTKGEMQPKASAWHDPEKTHKYVLAGLPRGFIDPRHAGVRFDEEFADLETPFEVQMSQQEKIAAMKPAPTGGGSGSGQTKTKSSKPNNGRPTGSKDGKQRTRTEKPRGSSADMADFAALANWARYAQSQVSNIVSPLILQFHKKDNQRQLSATQAAEAEKFKLTVLSKIEPYSEVSEEVVAKITSEGMGLNKTFGKLYDELCAKVKEKNHREPTVDEARLIQATTYAALNV